MRVVKSGCYVIRNIENNKIYVGSSKDFAIRKGKHWEQLRGGVHHSRYLQRAWDKYGETKFVWEIIEYSTVHYDPMRRKDGTTYSNDYKEMLVAREQYFMDLLKPAYNMNPIARSRLGTRHSPETIAKLKALRLTDEHKAKISIGRTGIGIGLPKPGSKAGVYGIEWNETRQRWLVRHEKRTRGQFENLPEAVAHLAKVQLDPNTPNPVEVRTLESIRQAAVLKGGKLYLFEGEERTASEIGRMVGLDRTTVRDRLERGEPIEHAIRPEKSKGGAKLGHETPKEARANIGHGLKISVKATAYHESRKGVSSKPTKSGLFAIAPLPNGRFKVRLKGHPTANFATKEEAIAHRDTVLTKQKG